MQERLCPRCIESGVCLFREAAKRYISEVPPLEKQTPVQPDNPATKEALRANNRIARERIIARKHGCPFLNEIKAENGYTYPGMENT